MFQTSAVLQQSATALYIGLGKAGKLQPEAGFCNSHVKSVEHPLQSLGLGPAACL